MERPVTQTRRPVARTLPPAGPSLDDFPAPGRAEPATKQERRTIPARSRAKVGADSTQAVEKPERPQRPERPDRFDWPPHLDTVEQLDRTERSDKPDPLTARRLEQRNRLERNKRLEKHGKPENSERLERHDKLERLELVDSLERSPRPEKSDRLERSDRLARLPTINSTFLDGPRALSTSPPTENMNGTSRYADSVSGASQRTFTYNRQRPAEKTPEHNHNRPVRSSHAASPEEEISPLPHQMPFWQSSASAYGDTRSVLSRSSSRTANTDIKNEGQRVAQVLSRRIQALEAELKQKKDIVVSISASVDKLQKDHVSQIHNMSRQHAKEIGDLEARLYAFESGAAVAPRGSDFNPSSLSEDRSGLEGILAEEVAERDEIISQREKTIEELREAERLAWEQIEEQAQCLVEKDKEYSKKLEEQRRTLVRGAEKIQKDLSARDEHIQRVLQELTQVKTENSQLRVEIESLQKGLEVAKVTAAKSEARRESLENSNDSLLIQIRQTEIELSKLKTTEVLPRVGSADTLRPQTAVATPSTAVQERETFLQKQITFQADEIRGLKTEMRTSRKESSQLESKLADLSAAKSELERQLQFKALEVDTLYKQLMTNLKHDDSHALLGERASTIASEPGVIEPNSPARVMEEHRDSWDMPGNTIGVQPVHGNAFQQAAQFASTSSF